MSKFKPFLSPAFLTPLTSYWKSDCRLKMRQRNLCLVYSYFLLHCHMVNSCLRQPLIGDRLENICCPHPCKLTQIPKYLQLLNSQKILLPFGPSRAMPWWITNIIKCPVTLVLWTTTCMWCNIHYQFAEFYKGKDISIQHQKVLPSLHDSANYF